MAQICLHETVNDFTEVVRMIQGGSIPLGLSLRSACHSKTGYLYLSPRSAEMGVGGVKGPGSTKLFTDKNIHNF